MITKSFDKNSQAIINPETKKKKIECDVIIASFSHEIEEYVLKNFNAKIAHEFKYLNDVYALYTFRYKGKKIGFYKTMVGAPASVCIFEDINAICDCKKYIIFGSAGTLDKNCYGKIIVPAMCYRDEGTSYHYVRPKKFIKIKNANIVSDFMKKNNIPYAEGKCWTTDALYRETINNVNKRQKQGCIAVDMECSAMQAVCDFRSVELYYFLVSGDLLDAPKWDEGELNNANHSYNNFDIAVKLACNL